MHRTAKQNRILAVCLAGGFTTMLDNSVLNIAVPALRSTLDASPTQIQWIVAGYSLAFGLALIPGGRLGDLRGRKQFFVAGIALFVLAGLVAATATDAWLLVAVRLLQGAGAGLVNSQMIGTLQDVFTGPARTKALGLYQVTCAVAIALGPPLGGALIALAGPEWGWRLAFLISAPSGLATLLLAIRHLPRPAPRAVGAAATPVSLDPFGLLLTAAITVTVMLPFVTPAGLPVKLGLGAGALALTGLLVWWQRRCVATGRQPLIHPALPRSAPYTLGTLTAMAQFGASLAGSLVLVMFLQDGLGLSPLAAAAVTLPSALAMAVVSSFAWRAVQRFGAHVVPLGLTLALAAVLLSGLAALWTTTPWLPVLLGLGQLCTGAAAGLVVSPNQAQVLRYAPAEAAGVAGGILQMSQRIAAAVGISAISGIYLNSSAADSGTAYFQAALACTAVFALALLLAVLANRRTRAQSETETEPESGAPARPGVREGAARTD
ncbi:MFS transporter [Kitasatospora sp. NPDC096147]|uniref:MFS transporter n=1 Tax=Kitasatospora sp. NPDC096147 TaxID=3364093 RepID=UPI0038153AF6